MARDGSGSRIRLPSLAAMALHLASWMEAQAQFELPRLVRDIYTATPSPPGLAPTAVGSLLFYLAADEAGQSELWVSDGSPGGSRLLLRVGVFHPEYPSILQLTAAARRLFFVVREGGKSLLWQSDGTPTGTTPFLAATATNAEPEEVQNPWYLVGGKDVLYFFSFFDGDSDRLWRTDGTAEGTTSVSGRTRTPETRRNLPALLQDRLIFVNEQASRERDIEPWISDGTEAGTHILKDIQPGPFGSFPSSFAVHGDHVYFAASTAEHGSELWRTGGSEDSTTLVRDIVRGPSSSAPNQLTSDGTRLFFATGGLTPGSSPILYWTDGSDVGTEAVVGAWLDHPISFQNLTGVGDRAFFIQPAGAGRTRLWATDGSERGSRVVGEFAGNVDAFSAYEDRLLFAAADAGSGLEPWISDGTAEGTRRLWDLWPGAEGSNPVDFTVVGDRVLFAATTDYTGFQLWSWKPGDAEPMPLHSLQMPTPRSAPREMLAVGEKIIFMATDRLQGSGWWASDGTALGTQPLPLWRQDSQRIVTTSRVRVHDRLYVAGTTYNKDTQERRAQLWVSDGTPQGTLQLEDIAITSFMSALSARSLPEIDSTLSLTMTCEDASSGFPMARAKEPDARVTFDLARWDRTPGS